MVSKEGTCASKWVMPIHWGMERNIRNLIFILENEEVKVYDIYSTMEAAASPFSAHQTLAAPCRDPGGPRENWVAVGRCRDVDLVRLFGFN